MRFRIRAAGCAAIAFALASTSCASSVTPPPFSDDSAARVRADLAALADDRFEGRETGTKGYDDAAAYVAERFAEAGLKPGGDGASYFQAVRLRGYALDPDTAAFEIVREDGSREALNLGADFAPSAHPLDENTNLEAPAVFVGFGVVAPERGRDDYAGVDVNGKIAVVLDGAPEALPSEERAHYGSGRAKAATAAARGAVGLVSLETPTAALRTPFERRSERLDARRMIRLDDAGAPIDVPSEIRAAASLSQAVAARLMPDYETLVVAAEGEAAVARPLNVRMKISGRTRHEPIASANVVGVLPGADRTLKSELVVLTAHLDHLGMRGEGADRIHNGALDNAAGVAALIETARLAVKGSRSKRTLVFAAVTAEESGFGGSETFAQTPSVAGRLVANVNLDMPILLYPFQDVIAFGAERSDLGPIVAAAAEGLGVALAPDPFPEQAIFVRSDHYSFVRQGVPSVMLATGWRGPGEKAWKDFLQNRYHRPSDDLSQPIDYEAGAAFARLNYDIARAIADAEAAPRWAAGDFFAALFGGPQADTVE